MYKILGKTKSGQEKTWQDLCQDSRKGVCILAKSVGPGFTWILSCMLIWMAINLENANEHNTHRRRYRGPRGHRPPITRLEGHQSLWAPTRQSHFLNIVLNLVINEAFHIENCETIKNWEMK